MIRLSTAALFVAAILSSFNGTFAAPILTPADSIIAIDFDPAGSNSSYPDNEDPPNAVDGSLDKYLNTGGFGSGFIVTPSATSTVQSFQLTTANDAEGRDPSTYELWGTNDAIVSADNSDGLGGENWQSISSGPVTLPSDRDTPGPVVPITNGSSYSSYKMHFPSLKQSQLFQIAEVSFFESNDGSGDNVLSESDPILAVDLAPDSGYYGIESPANLLDGDIGTKYLNFGRENSGFIVTPSGGADVVKSFRIATANDAPSRDPSTWELYGTDEPIMSQDNSRGDGESWTLVDSGAVDLPMGRDQQGPFVLVDNDTAYASYRMVFPTVRDPEAGDADSMQIAGIQFHNEAIPEPASLMLCLAGLAAGCCYPRRHQ